DRGCDLRIVGRRNRALVWMIRRGSAAPLCQLRRAQQRNLVAARGRALVSLPESPRANVDAVSDRFHVDCAELPWLRRQPPVAEQIVMTRFAPDPVRGFGKVVGVSQDVAAGQTDQPEAARTRRVREPGWIELVATDFRPRRRRHGRGPRLPKLVRRGGGRLTDVADRWQSQTDDRLPPMLDRQNLFGYPCDRLEHGYRCFTRRVRDGAAMVLIDALESAFDIAVGLVP